MSLVLKLLLIIISFKLKDPRMSRILFSNKQYLKKKKSPYIWDNLVFVTSLRVTKFCAGFNSPVNGFSTYHNSLYINKRCERLEKFLWNVRKIFNTAIHRTG